MISSTRVNTSIITTGSMVLEPKNVVSVGNSDSIEVSAFNLQDHEVSHKKKGSKASSETGNSGVSSSRAHRDEESVAGGYTDPTLNPANWAISYDQLMEIEEVLRFWFEEAGPEKWWNKSDEFDEEIRSRCGVLRDV